jgi:hypothetical protein
MVVDVIAMDMVQMAVVKIIGVTVVLDCGVAAGRSMRMGVASVCCMRVSHGQSFVTETIDRVRLQLGHIGTGPILSRAIDDHPWASQHRPFIITPRPIVCKQSRNPPQRERTDRFARE